MKKYYMDVDPIGEMFCNSKNCNECQGTDYNGEPSGYGCDAMEAFIDKCVESDEYEETDCQTLYYSVAEADAEIEAKDAEIERLREGLEAIRARVENWKESESLGNVLLSISAFTKRTLSDE